MDETLYLDASAIVKLYVEEEGSDVAATAVRATHTQATSLIAYVEVGRAIAGRATDETVRDGFRRVWADDWEHYTVVGLDRPLAEHATSLAIHHGLRSMDAIHLASALALPPAPLRFATWDRRLWEAARAVGLRTVPATCP